MRFKNLGRTGLQVSELCFGAMTFGGTSDMWKAIGGVPQDAANAMIGRCLDAGINFFDTADGYGDGDSERMLGAALGNKRASAVIATKAGFPTGTGPNDRGASRRHLVAACEDSLRRLGTTWIDLYIIHRRDPRTPLDETMRALDDLTAAGKIRYAGVSNFPAWQIMKANAIAERSGGVRFECLQAYYNLAARELERELAPMMESENVGLMVWSPLASGALTGKYGKDGKAPEGARRANFEIGPLDWARVERIINVAREIAARERATVPQVALAWLLAQPFVTSIVLGAKRMDQLEDNLGSLAVQLTQDDLARLGAASAIAEEYPGWFLKLFDGL